MRSGKEYQEIRLAKKNRSQKKREREKLKVTAKPLAFVQKARP